MYQGVKVGNALKQKLSEFIDAEVEGFKSVLCIVGPTVADSYRAGSALAELAVDKKVAVAVIGFKSLLRAYKSSFRDPELKSLLHDKFNHNRIIVFTNINDASTFLWGDARDLEWFRSVVKQRASMQLKSVFCVESAFSVNSLRNLLGADNAQLCDIGTLKCVRLSGKES